MLCLKRNDQLLVNKARVMTSQMTRIKVNKIVTRSESLNSPAARILSLFPVVQSFIIGKVPSVTSVPIQKAENDPFSLEDVNMQLISEPNKTVLTALQIYLFIY